jgi:hypothetical protein
MNLCNSCENDLYDCKKATKTKKVCKDYVKFRSRFDSDEPSNTEIKQSFYRSQSMFK